MDHHGTENGILFFFRPSRHSSLHEKEIQYFYSNHQSVSSWFTDQKPNIVLLNTNIEKYRFPQHAAPPDSSTTLAGQAAHKQRCGGLYLWGSLPLFLHSWKHHQDRFASNPLCVPTTSCSQSQGCTSRALPPPQARAGTSKASSLNTRETSFCHFSALLVSQTEREKFTYLYLIKINVTSWTPHRGIITQPSLQGKRKSHQLYFVNLCKSL